jgi:hypothetical protein
LFGSVVLDENGFGTSPQREELRVLEARRSIRRSIVTSSSAPKRADPSIRRIEAVIPPCKGTKGDG